MLGDTNVAAVLAVKDMDKARKFYGETLGLQVESDDEGGILYKSGDSKVFVYQSQYAGTNQATAAAWNTKDVDKVVEELKAKGVTFEHYNDMPGAQLEGDIHVMGDIKAAWFKDPDGNILNIVNM